MVHGGPVLRKPFGAGKKTASFISLIVCASAARPASRPVRGISPSGTPRPAKSSSATCAWISSTPARNRCAYRSAPPTRCSSAKPAELSNKTRETYGKGLLEKKTMGDKGALMMAPLATFPKGGVHPKANKDLSSALPIETMPDPSKVSVCFLNSMSARPARWLCPIGLIPGAIRRSARIFFFSRRAPRSALQTAGGQKGTGSGKATGLAKSAPNSARCSMPVSAARCWG